MNLCDKAPSLPPSVFVAPSAAIVGDVNVGSGSSIWYGCILKGNFNTHFLWISSWHACVNENSCVLDDEDTCNM